MTTTLKHPVSQTKAICPAILMPKEHKHQFQTPNFREMVIEQIKAIMGGIRNYGPTSSARSSFRGIYCGN
jgi:membrane protein CcdC involved in cytochrome C biogenesis